VKFSSVNFSFSGSEFSANFGILSETRREILHFFLRELGSFLVPTECRRFQHTALHCHLFNYYRERSRLRTPIIRLVCSDCNCCTTLMGHFIFWVYLFTYLLRNDHHNSSNKRTSKCAGQRPINWHLGPYSCPYVCINNTSKLACISQKFREVSAGDRSLETG